MSLYPKIWFLRHGQTEWNRAYRLQGQLDSPLTPQGIEDAQRQRTIMRDELGKAQRIVSSPLGRARQTADIVLDGRPYDTDDRLMEIHAGDWQGRLRSEILDDNPDWKEHPPSALEIYETAPQGEGLEAFRSRILSFLDTLDGPTIIVAHGLLGQVLRAHVLGVPPQQAGRLSNLQGCVYLLENGSEILVEAEV